jgi:hypothetical protein
VNPAGGTINAAGGVEDFGMGPNNDGWHNIEIRMQNGGGGAGPVTQDGFSSNYGIGFSPLGRVALNGQAFAARGVISTQFVSTPTGWRISAMAWDDERPGLALPARYEPPAA